MKKLQNFERGVTLISLIVVIIVLLIIAGIATYSGVNTAKSAKLTVFTTELKIVQNKVNELYKNYKDKTVQEIEQAEIGKNKELLDTNVRVIAFNGAGIIENDDFVYWDHEILEKLGMDKIEGEFLVNFKTRQIIATEGYTYEGVTYYTLEQLPKGLYNVKYEEENEIPTFDVMQEKMPNKKWKITISNIQYAGNIKKWDVQYVTPSGEKKTTKDMSFIVEEIGKYRVLIKNGDIFSAPKEIEIFGGALPGKIVTTAEKNNYTDDLGYQATIPKGFMVVPGCEKIEEGLVISDNPTDTEEKGKTQQAYGNQFVWIPVRTEEEYTINYNYPTFIGWKDSPSLAYDEVANDTGYLPLSINPGADDSQTNKEAEKKAVLKYNGFFIGRYEAGMYRSELVCKKSTYPCHDTQAKEMCKEMYSDSPSVASALCSGTQWDMVMAFVNGKNDGMGKIFNVIKGDPSRHRNSIESTGNNLNDKVQNIYDLEGNCRENVAERLLRYNPYCIRSNNSAASYRTDAHYNELEADGMSFRVVLYVK